MYIKSLEYSTIEFIKSNLNSIYKDLKKSSLIEVIENQFGIGWHKPSKIIKPELELFIDKNIKPRDTDIDNAKTIYESLKNLTESQASDERLWAGLSIESEIYEYLKYRWKDTINTLKYRVVFHQPSKRGIMYHGLARLWWFAHITYDETLINPYELTEFAFKYPHILEKMIYRNFSNSSNIRIGIINGIKSYIDTGGKYTVGKIDYLYKEISTLGSVSLIDNYSFKEITDITKNTLDRYDEK